MLSLSHLTVLDAPPPQLVDVAAEAGFDAVGLRVWPGGDEPAYPMLDGAPMLRETLTRLDHTGLRVLDVEVLRLRPDSRPADALRILDRADHPAGAVLVDALHLQRSGGVPADVAALPWEHLPYAQLCDGPLDPVLPPDDVARAEARSGRLLPGDGQLPLAALIRALPAGVPLAVAAPVAGHAGRPAVERARAAFIALARVAAARVDRSGADR